jgi:hypothetical protein
LGQEEERRRRGEEERRRGGEEERRRGGDGTSDGAPVANPASRAIIRLRLPGFGGMSPTDARERREPVPS